MTTEGTIIRRAIVDEMKNAQQFDSKMKLKEKMVSSLISCMWSVFDYKFHDKNKREQARLDLRGVKHLHRGYQEFHWYSV